VLHRRESFRVAKVLLGLRSVADKSRRDQTDRMRALGGVPKWS
jgi:hypothetical protein